MTRSFLRILLLGAAGSTSVALCCCASDAAKAPRSRPPPLVTTMGPELRDVPVAIRAPVELRPLARADVGAKTLGYLDAVLVDRGDVVRRGQLLAVVRPSELPDQLEAARSSFAQAQAAATLARANKERAESLAPKGVVSQQELQQAVTALAAAEAALSAASSQVGVLATRLGETRIESPLDGVVSQRRLDPGALVGPSTASILTVDRIDTLRIFVPVNEGDVTQLRIGQDARIELDATPGQAYSGRVVRISPAFDPLTRTLDAEVHLKNPGELRAGMYGRASIITAVHHEARVLPVGAVQVTSDRHFVFVVRGDKVKRVQVTVGVDGGDWLEITSGLAPDDEVVTAGMDALSDGSPVRIKRNVDPYTGGPASPTSVRE